MHLLISKAGRIERVGPTFAKLQPKFDFLGKSIFDIFHLRHKHLGDHAKHELGTLVGGKLHLEFQTRPQTTLKGFLVNLPQTDAMLLNLSFGISVVDAVRDYSLTIRDFAPTDLTVEMLYQFEAKHVIMNESRELNQRLQDACLAAEIQASTDALTGLKNRRALDQVLSSMVLSRKVFGLMHLDLDFFKEVNDTFGHAAGDKVLQMASSVFLDETRVGDTVARVGGDEFILVFNDLVDERRLMKIADRIDTRLEQPLDFRGQFCKISGSVGVTTSKFYDVPDADRMLSDADFALYASKSNGRACATMATIDLLRTSTDLVR